MGRAYVPLHAGAYKGVFDMVVRVVQKEGPKALFGGLGPSLVGAEESSPKTPLPHFLAPLLSRCSCIRHMCLRSEPHRLACAGIIPFAGTQFFVYDGLRCGGCRVSALLVHV